MAKKRKFRILELLGVISTVLGIFKGMLMELPFQLWLIIVLSAFTIYWVGREGLKREETTQEFQPNYIGTKHVVINV